MDLELNTSTAVEVAVESAIHEIDSLTVSMDGTDALEVTFDSNEFSIVGDDMVIVTKYEDAPQWLKDTIDNVVNIKTAVAVGDLNATKEALDVMLGELEVAKNTYQLSIISSADIDSRITTAITSLNSALRDADATILEVANTAVTPSEASAIALNTLSASLSSNGEIGSALHNLQTAMTTLENTTASDISYLESTMEGEIVGNANAMQTIRTYVGIDEAGASTGTGLSAYLEGNDGNFGSAGSQINNDIKVTAEGIESKWAYNSTVKINGVSYSSGFGIATSLTSGSGLPTGQSEFWIKADKFKLMSADGLKKSSYSPFTVDANTGSIKFNGTVEFTSIDNRPVINKTYVQTSQPTSGMNKGDTWIDTDDNNSLYTYNGSSWIKTQSGSKTYLQSTAPATGMVAGDIWVDSDDNYKQYRYNGSSWVALAYNPATAINAGTTTIDGGKITTGSITASQIQANSISADRLLSSNGVSTVWNGGGLVSANFNGNVNGNIGSPTQGFRLSSNAAGTTTNPNIYGAYIKGGTVEGADFIAVTLDVGNIVVRSSTDASKTGRISYSTSSGILVGSNYGTGFLANRVCSSSSSIVAQGFMNVTITDDGEADNTSTIANFAFQYTSNGGSSWNTIDTTSYSFIWNGRVGDTPGVNTTLSFSSVLTGSIVPTTGSISFRCILVSSSGANVTIHGSKFLVTVYNQ